MALYINGVEFSESGEVRAVTDYSIYVPSGKSVDFYIGGSKVMDMSSDGAKTTLIGLSGDYWQIGTQATDTSHSLDSENDLFIVGDLEVGGAFHPNAMTLGGTVTLGSQQFDGGSGRINFVTTGAYTMFATITNDGSGDDTFRITNVSTTPAANDIVLGFRADGKDLDSPQNGVTYGNLRFQIEDATANAAGGKFAMYLLRAQSSTLAMTVDSLGALWIDAGLTTSKLNYKAEADLTIASGAVAVTQTYHSIIVQGGGGGGNDQLDTATGGAEGDILILKPNTSGGSDTVTIADATGANTFILAGGANFAMDHIDDRIMFIHNGTEWVEISRSSNS